MNMKAQQQTRHDENTMKLIARQCKAKLRAVGKQPAERDQNYLLIANLAMVPLRPHRP